MKPDIKITQILESIKTKINSVVEGNEFHTTLTDCAGINRTDIFSETNIVKAVNIRMGKTNIQESVGQWYHTRDVYVDVIANNADQVILMLADILKVIRQNEFWDNLACGTSTDELTGPIYDNDGIKLADDSIPLRIDYKTMPWEI